MFPSQLLVAAGIPGLVASLLQAAPPSSRDSLLLSLECLIRILAVRFRATPDNLGRSHLEILN